MWEWSDQLEAIKEQIERYRKQLIRTTVHHGLNSPETLRLSELLDQLVLEYQRILAEREKTLKSRDSR